MQHPLHCFERGDVNRSFIGAGAQQIHGSKVQSGVQEHAVPHRCELSCSQAEALEAQAGLPWTIIQPASNSWDPRPTLLQLSST